MPIEIQNQRFLLVKQVQALCGGKFPLAEDFAWERAECFHLEDDVLQPYAGNMLLPMPGITVNAYVESWPS